MSWAPFASQPPLRNQDDAVGSGVLPYQSKQVSKPELRSSKEKPPWFILGTLGVTAEECGGLTGSSTLLGQLHSAKYSASRCPCETTADCPVPLNPTLNILHYNPSAENGTWPTRNERRRALGNTLWTARAPTLLMSTIQTLWPLV